MLWIALTFAAEPTWELSQSLEGAPSYGDKTRCMTKPIVFYSLPETLLSALGEA